MVICRISICLGLLAAVFFVGCGEGEKETYKMKEKGTANISADESNKQSMTLNPNIEP